MKKKATNKEIIFREAARLFSEKGYERTSMRAVAEAAGVSKPAIYYYFCNKEALFEAMLEMAISHIVDTMESVRKADLSPLEKLSVIAVHRFELYIKHPEVSKFLMDLSVWNIKKNLMLNFLEKHSDIRTIMSDIIIEGQKSGLFKREVDPLLTGHMFLGGLNMYLMNYIKTREGELTADKAREFVTTLFNGIGLTR
ncbi:MAG: TetR/AcrR family transcriptional regulator [Candidatus Neomarinimicrobiota bacterium]